MNESRIVFEFRGGRLDGKSASSDSIDFDEARAAATFYRLTDDGALGHCVSTGFDEYQVVEHLDDDSGIVVRCRASADRAAR